MVADSTNMSAATADEAFATKTISGGGLTARILSWGATLQSLVPDWQDFSVIVGAQDPAAYRADLLYFGAIVGPVANRIAGGRFTLNGREFTLDRNEADRTTLHGGAEGFGERNWDITDAGPDFVTLQIMHPDGLCGFPGPITTAVTYRLPGDGVLEIEITGHAEADALFNPAFHGYWNLDGGPDILDHRLTVAADHYTPVDDHLIPLGHAAPVADTVFDYRSARPVAPDIDHNLCTGNARGALRHVATLEGSKNRLTLATTEPGLQVYAAANSPSGAWAGLDGKPFGPNAGIALEPQLWPDAPNNPGFPPAKIAAGERITQLSRFRLTPVAP